MDAHTVCVCAAWQGDSFNAGLIHIQSCCNVFCDKAKLTISFSVAASPCESQSSSSVPIKTEVAGRLPQYILDRDQVCPLIKAHWKGEGKITGK